MYYAHVVIFLILTTPSSECIANINDTYIRVLHPFRFIEDINHTHTSELQILTTHNQCIVDITHTLVSVFQIFPTHTSVYRTYAIVSDVNHTLVSVFQLLTTPTQLYCEILTTTTSEYCVLHPFHFIADINHTPVYCRY